MMPGVVIVTFNLLFDGDYRVFIRVRVLALPSILIHDDLRFLDQMLLAHVLLFLAHLFIVLDNRPDQFVIMLKN
jgi:hypothetical protein